MSSRKPSTRKTRSQDAKASPSTPSTIKIKVPAPGSARRPSTPAPSPAPRGQSTLALDSTSRLPSTGLPPLSTLPKLGLDDYEQPFYPGLENYPWPSDLIFDTVELQEAAPFAMDKATAKSFYFLLHPAIGHLVPFIRRQIHVEANSKAVQRALFSKALPIFETYYVNHQRTGRSQLLGGVVHRLCELAAPLGGSLAPRVRSLLQPGRFDKPAKVPINFDLPIYGATPPHRLHFETYPYSPEERAAIAPFCFQPFIRIFSILRKPNVVTPERESVLLPHIACAMEFFTNWVKDHSTGTPFPPMQQRLFVSLRLAIQNLTQDRQTKRWLKTIPDVGKEPFPNSAFSLARTTYRPRPFGSAGLSNVHPLYNTESSERCINFEQLIKLPPFVPPIETLATLESSPPARPIKEKAAVEKTPPTRFSRKPSSFAETRPSSAPAPASVPTTPTPVPATPVAETPATPALFLPPPEELFSSGSNDEGKGKATFKTGPPKRKRVEDGDQNADPPRSLEPAGGKSTAPKGAPVSSPERPSKWPRHTMEVVIPRDSALHTHATRSSTAAPDSEPNSSPSPSPGPRTRARTKIASNKTLKGSKLKKKKSSKRRSTSPGFDTNFPPPVRPHRGEQRGKLTTKTAREPPPNSYTNVVDAIRRGMSSLLELPCLSCICFNKDCKARTTGQRCESCKYSMCSHTLTAEDIHKRVQALSEYTVFSNNNLMSAMQTVKRESEDLLLLQAQVSRQTARLRAASNYFAMLIRAMIQFYGRDNFAFLWKVPERHREFFMNYILHNTALLKEGHEFSADEKAAVKNRFGYVEEPWSEEFEQGFIEELNSYTAFEPNPTDPLFVGPFSAEWASGDHLTLSVVEDGRSSLVREPRTPTPPPVASGSGSKQ
ncbi:hypothetical protein B0H16DRAFT_1476868 [Mycena metata]|uniref:Uncharacterized protein n=1 Tax=Mycena metata TaxID=1033252 RepID=A0AAD7MGF0_9AGAR|nr:hypothetical protein B0H16DRAFT_1476868 [Mycena metata]